MRITRYSLLFSVLCVFTLNAGDKIDGTNPEDIRAINRFYDRIWSDSPMTKKPVPDHITIAEVSEKLTGIWTYYSLIDKLESPEKITVIFKKDKTWQESLCRENSDFITSGGTGYWVLVSDKVVLIDKKDRCRAFVISIKNKWYWIDFDVENGITELSLQRKLLLKLHKQVSIICFGFYDSKETDYVAANQTGRRTLSGSAIKSSVHYSVTT